MPRTILETVRSLVRRPGRQGMADISPGGDKLGYLRAIDIFRDLGPDEMAWMEQITRMVTAERGQLMYSQEDEGEALFLLKTGRVQIYRLTPEGKRLELATITPGTFFGEMPLLGQHMYQGFAEAVEPSTICVMGQADLQRILVAKPQVALRMLEVLGRRLMDREQRLEELAYRSVPARLAAVLVRLADERGTTLEGLTHNDLAEMVGAYRETVTKALDEFKVRGLVELKRRRIVVRDLDALRALAS